SVYPEHLPASVRRVGSKTRLDQLVEREQRPGGVPLLDLRGPLREAKARERVFHRTDTHWNERGAFAAYQAVGNALAGWFPQVRPLPRSAFASVSTVTPGGDLAVMLGLSALLPEERLGLEPRVALQAHPVPRTDKTLPYVRACYECEDPALPRAVVFHD